MKTKKTFLVLPGCDDTNRGDQALIWETVKVAEDAGFKGEFFMIASSENSLQSKGNGINNIDYVLPHPSTHFKKNNNIQYGKILKFKWAAVSILDGTKALILLTDIGRRIALKLGGEKIKNSLSIYEKAGAAFVKGGGFIHSYGGFLSTYAVFYDLYHIMLAHSMHIPVYIMPNSYGPFKSPGTAWLVNKVLNKCKLVTARESISKNMLKDVTGVESELFQDLAFHLSADTELNEEQVKAFRNIPFESKKCVALTMRPYRFPSSENPDKEYKQYKNSLCKFITWLSRNGYYPVLVEHTFSHTEHERDMSCIQDVANQLGTSCEYSIYSDLTLTCAQLKYVYSHFHTIVGTRFHSVIFSISEGVPAIAITYGGNKGQGIMHDMKLDEYAISIDNLSYDTLKEKFELLQVNRESVSQKINEYIAFLRSEREILVEMVRKK